MKNKNESAPSTSYSDEIWKDSRFSHLINDPRFKELPQATRKVKIDKRFESMFSDQKFKVKYTVDKYGRKTNKTSSEDLKKFYALDKSDSDDDEEPVKDVKKYSSSSEEDVQEKGKDEFGNDLLDSVEDLPGDVKLKLHDKAVDYARGLATLDSESSSDEESSEEDENDEMFIQHVWGELDRDAPRTDDITNRLAVCNMDWDRIKAVDIMILCSSFLPQGGIILSVTIYPSEFGKERMAEEDLKGPQELTDIKLDINEDENYDDDERKITEKDEEEGSHYHMEKLRTYQLNRLKYFYAVIECDSNITANKLYEECDGLEYESSATKLDLRFIPNDVTFDDDVPKEVCTSLPDLTSYKPRLFTTTALQQAKVELTWDEMNLDRKELSTKLLNGKLTDVTDAELRRYVAYSSEEDEEDNNLKNDEIANDSSDDIKSNENAIDKYKELLMGIQQKEEEKKNKQFEIEYSWGIGTQDKIGKLVQKKKNEKKVELAPFEKMIEKKKEKIKTKKMERKKMLGKNKDKHDNNNDGWSSDDMPDDINMNDPYFAEEFENGDFEEKPKTKKKERKSNLDDNPEEIQKNAELALLMDDYDEDDKVHFSLKKIQDAENITKTQTKKKKKKLIKKKKSEIENEKKLLDDNFTVNIDDNRFSALYTSHHFSIDPTDSHYKKTKGMETIITEKLKRRKTQSDDENDNDSIKKPKKDIAISMLVKSIKRKVGKK